MENIGIFKFSDFCIFKVLYGVPEVREVSRNLPGARGFVVIEYGPVASHGDPIQARIMDFICFYIFCQNLYPGGPGGI